jgi:hypothetical protein
MELPPKTPLNSGHKSVELLEAIVGVMSVLLYAAKDLFLIYSSNDVRLIPVCHLLLVN